MKFISATLLLLVSAATASAAQPISSYAERERRGIKALAPEEIDGLLAGKGLGYAKSAELNNYPGPAHVLELAAQLQLTAAQRQSSRAIHARMEEKAMAAGARLVAAEAELEQLFRSETANEENLETALETISKFHNELRGVHLIAHVQQRSVLSPEQTSRYLHLRGYHGGNHEAPGHSH